MKAAILETFAGVLQSRCEIRTNPGKRFDHVLSLFCNSHEVSLQDQPLRMLPVIEVCRSGKQAPAIDAYSVYHPDCRGTMLTVHPEEEVHQTIIWNLIVEVRWR